MTRERIAIAALTSALVAGPAGAFLEFGLGWALIVACGLLIGLALLLGWS